MLAIFNLSSGGNCFLKAIFPPLTTNWLTAGGHIRNADRPNPTGVDACKTELKRVYKGILRTTRLAYGTQSFKGHVSGRRASTIPWILEITMDVIRILLAIILPPLGVFLQVGIGLHFWVNILLTLLGYVPGIIHAIWVIVKK
jgi:uncharacterized membrane protein YqaE (UPF0057 family)